MARRKRKVLRTVRKVLPKIYRCPRCGAISVRISNDADDDVYTVACGNCGLKYQKTAPKVDIIDLYNEFVDKFNRGDIQ